MRRAAPLALVLALGCGGDGGSAAPDSVAPDVAACSPADLYALAAELPDFPAPLAPGLEGPAALSTDAADRLVLDPDPSTRGEHPALAVTRAPPDCEVALTPLDALPLPDTPGATRDIGDGAVDPGRGGLVVLGADLAPALEAATWDDVFAGLGVRGALLERPSRAAFEEALVDTCAGLEEGGLFVLVLAGRGAALGTLVLAAGEAAPEVIAYARIDDLIADHCAHLGRAIWIVDASRFDLEAPLLRADGPPTLVLRASDRAAPDAARATRHGPGLLGQVIADALEPGRASLCAAPEQRLHDAEIGAFFASLTNAELGYQLQTHRWQTFGVPAVARLAAEGRLTPYARDQLQAALASAIPNTPVLARGTPPATDRCVADPDCAQCPAATCMRPACVGGLCRQVPDDGARCDDGDPCTVDETCAVGSCRGAARSCDDGNPCTDEVCEPALGCVSAARDGATCDDGDPCTRTDTCDEEGACVGIALVCDDADPCTADRCEPDPSRVEGAPGKCVHQPTSDPCDDGDACTLADQCRSGVCTGTRRVCSDGDECTVDRCEPATGQCRFDPLVDLAACDDGDPCTSLDRCRDGACQGLAATCDDGLACTFDRCEAGACVHLPAPGQCRAPDGASCVPVGERPAGFECLVCAATDRLEPVTDGATCGDDGIACTDDVCQRGACVHRDAPDRCHRPDGVCVGVGEPVTGCLVCQGGGVVTAVDAGEACADGCASGTCDGLGNCTCR